MSFTELPEIKEGSLHIGCLNCSTASMRLDMDRILAAGFGDVVATKNGKEVYSEHEYYREHPEADFLTAQYIEDMAAKDPDNDWRIVFETPLHGETYQRHKDGVWYCIESNKGFA